MFHLVHHRQPILRRELLLLIIMLRTILCLTLCVFCLCVMCDVCVLGSREGECSASAEFRPSSCGINSYYSDGPSSFVLLVQRPRHLLLFVVVILLLRPRLLLHVVSASIAAAVYLSSSAASTLHHVFSCFVCCVFWLLFCSFLCALHLILLVYNIVMWPSSCGNLDCVGRLPEMVLMLLF